MTWWRGKGERAAAMIGGRGAAEGRSEVGTASAGRGGSDSSRNGNDSRGWCRRSRGGRQRKNRGNRKIPKLRAHLFDLREIEY